MTNQTPDSVEQFYDNVVEREVERLTRHRMEHAITRRALAQYLPEPPAEIADVGGGPGRYALELAGHGYTVTLLDLSSRALDEARGLAAAQGVALNDYIHTDARDLSMLPSDTFDAVLLLGPLYHLLSSKDRTQAIAEARRVLRPGGIIFTAFIARYSAFRDAARRDPMKILESRDWVETVLTTGQHTPSSGRFTFAYFAHPAEIAPLMESGGFATMGLLACEGIVSGIDQQVNELEGEAWEAWVDLNYRLASDPSIHGAADHLLYIGSKLPDSAPLG